jgi:hypothetical protein
MDNNTNDFGISLAIEQLRDSEKNFLLLVQDKDAKTFRIESAVDHPDDLKVLVASLLNEYGKVYDSVASGYDPQEHEASED